MSEREPSAEQITSFENLEMFVGRRVSIHVFPEGTETLEGILENYVADTQGNKTFLVRGGGDNQQWIDRESFPVQQPHLVE